jgi:hypothetical protein
MYLRIYSLRAFAMLLPVILARCTHDLSVLPTEIQLRNLGNGRAKQLGFVAQPSSVLRGEVMIPAVQVAIQDRAGRTITKAAAIVTVAITTGSGASGAVLSGTLSRAAVGGIATFDDLTIDREGSGFTITASTPDLLNGVSQSFDVGTPSVATCGTSTPGRIWCDDFDTDRLSSYFEVVTNNGNLARVPGIGRNGSVGLRSRFNAGEISGGNLKLAFGRTPSSYIRPVDGGTRDYREIYWRVYMKNQPGWIGGGADKLSRLMILARADWSQAMIAHVWSDSPPYENYLLIDPASGTDPSGTLVTSGYNDFAHLRWLGYVRGTTPMFDAARVGQWYCIEAHVKLNTPGQSDGVFELRIDGQLEAARTGMNWVGSFSDYGLNALFLENYWNAGSPTTQERYFDDFVVSETPIGC